VASAISGLIDTASDMGSDGADIFGFASSIASGNILGAASEIFGLFGIGLSPSKDQLILDSISDLKQDIQYLGQQMNSRFDRVDSKLNEIMDTLNTNFNTINTTLGVISGDLNTIKNLFVNKIDFL
jgi:hypothetical protein